MSMHKTLLAASAMLAVTWGTACGGDDDNTGDDDMSDAGDAMVVIHLDGGDGDADGGDGDADGGDGDGDGSVTTECTVGEACTMARGCREGDCYAESANEVGSVDDPINLPDGGVHDPVETTYWPGGYCVPMAISETVHATCDTSTDEGCPDCASCISLGDDYSLCFNKCTPSSTDNDVCRDGYECDIGINVCYFGCGSDDECRFYRADGNGDGDVVAPDDSNIDTPVDDPLVWDVDSQATCNPDTFRCDQPAGDKTAGEACEKSSECEENGVCLTGIPYSVEGERIGTCTKYGCDLEGRGCAGDAKCTDHFLGVHLCLAPCTLAAEADMAELRHGETGHGVGCPQGYRCLWDGESDEVENNGVCFPGEYNDVAEPNIGAACNEDSECWSDFGMGQCLELSQLFGGGYCSMLDCDAPGIDSDSVNVCGENAACVAGLFSDTALCMEKCEAPADCRDGYACIQLTMDDPQMYCLDACSEDTDCKDTEECVPWDVSDTSLGSHCAAR